MAARRQHQFTVYDAMEARGDFDKNPANAGAYDRTSGDILYQGPVQYPKMLYHPDGETRITKPAEEIVTPFGPKRVGEQREIIWRIVNSPAEEAEWKSKGWHNHPRGAIVASGGEAPPPSLEEQLEALKAELAALKENAPEEDAPTPTLTDLTPRGIGRAPAHVPAKPV